MIYRVGKWREEVEGREGICNYGNKSQLAKLFTKS